MAKTEIGAGDIVIKLGEQELVLKPTLRATKALSRKYGGTAQIVQRLSSIDLDAIVDVITLGAGLTEHGAKGLDEKVFSAGLMDQVGPCIKYVHILSNGGRPLETEDGNENPQEENS